MPEGFIFNHNKCVSCSACSAACILENGWTVSPRLVYTYNSQAISAYPIVNISLACNHCKEAVCLIGCPTGSYFREPVTGAIVIEDSKCIGCKYCQWNCPYDAPKFDRGKRIIGKCNLCYSGLIEGKLPACTNACPTGALKFGELSDSASENIPSWIPDKNLNPSVEFTGNMNMVPLRIIPGKIFENEINATGNNEKSITGEWSLIGFSFLSTLSVSTLISSIINGNFPNLILLISTIVLAGSISLFHLGRVMRSWRSLRQLKISPLSREIAAFIIYSSVSLFAGFLKLPAFLIASSVIGLILLILIDSVYIYADRRNSIIYHSGQTFLSSLLIISFFTGSEIPFIFIALIKIVISVFTLSVNRITGNNFGLRFLRLAFLLVTGISLITGFSFPDPVIVTLFLAGELLDRIFFYIDFNPMNIKLLIKNNSISEKDEKERG
jgi:Fe-S-cluster-containing dehydrogenase component/DMSO reductase anchor subunit